MELSRMSCRLCLSETEFNVSLFGNYSRKTNMVDKILVCLKIVIEEGDPLDTICYKCADNVERYYDFIMFVKKSQTKFVKVDRKMENTVNRRLVTSYVREQIYDADYTFSFLEIPDEKKEQKVSSPFFSYFSPPNMLVKQKDGEPLWKTPETREKKCGDKLKRPYKTATPRHHSRDLFESQDVDETDARSLDWKLTPDDNIIKRVRDKCFGRSDF